MASTNQDLDSVAIVSAIIGQKKPFVFDWGNGAKSCVKRHETQ